MRITNVVVLVSSLLGPGLAVAQPMAVEPRPPGPGVVTPVRPPTLPIPGVVTPVRPPITVLNQPAEPLTAAGRDMLLRGMRDYLTRRAADQPSREALLAAGLRPNNNAVEMAHTVNGRQVAPLHMGVATRGAPSASTTDPAVQDAARLAAARRLGRQPTPAEVTSEVASFDRNVARINAELALRHAEIKAAYRQTGQFPREIEAPILGVRPRDPEAVNPSEATRNAWRDALTRFVNSIAATPPRVPQ